MASDFVDLGTPDAVSYTWELAAPTSTFRAVSGQFLARADQTPYRILRAVLAPMPLKDAHALRAKINSARGRSRPIHFGFIQPSGADEWVPGNFAKWSNHERLYELVEVPAGINIPDGGSVTPAGTLPSGWEIFPQVTGNINGDTALSPPDPKASLSLATYGRFVLMDDNFELFAEGRSATISLDLQEAPTLP